ncbi:uncharacterized protein LOC143062870 [Mytilus galloprovincialis]|uniref:Uncharacterized protein n=3 Tax=Mytilus galloprovincialis TaxID=29158 RepID=A0A8B6E3I9_MYTGA|nr:Hypothetical predicted protein [Mytilus galloprovincialis]
MRTKSELYLQMVYFSCCFLIWMLLVCPIGVTEARSISDEEYFPMSLEKRNSWWSKKSLENVPNYQNGLSLQDTDIGCEAVIDVFKCYSQYCVPDFVACSRESDDIYDMCKVEHDLCASKCFDSGSDQVKR